MADQQHTIKNQICEIEVPAHVDYNRLKDRISHALQRLVYPKLGVICDKYSKSSTHYNIKSLEIDLGTVDLSDVTSVLLGATPQKFETALLNALKKFPKREIFVESSAIEDQVQSQEIELEIQTVKYFLNTGTLPWWNKDSKKSLTSMLIKIATGSLNKTKQLLSSLNKKAWNRLIIQQNDYQLLFLAKKFLPELQHNTDKLHRDLQKLIYSTKIASIISHNKLRQHYWSFVIIFAINKSSEKNPIAFIDELVSYLVFSTDKVHYKELVEQIAQQVIIKPSSIHPAITSWAKKVQSKSHALFQWFSEVNKVAEDISTLLLKKKEKSLCDKILRIFKNFTINPGILDKNLISLIKVLFELTHLLQEISKNSDSNKFKDLYQKIIRLMQQVQIVPFIPASALQYLKSNLANLDANHQKNKVQGQPPGLELQQNKDLTFEISRDKKLSAFSQEFTSLNQTHYIENAGLVLYWVYLKNLFTKFGVLKENQAEFLNHSASIRATLLLNLCVYGHARNTPEYELVLNKILCGLQINLPLPSTLRIKSTEKQEGDILTSILISHWKALGKITVEGFRKEFIQRSGSITQQEGQWLLRVEKKPQDILLNKLPWTINVIKLPWMKDYLTVEW